MKRLCIVCRTTTTRSDGRCLEHALRRRNRRAERRVAVALLSQQTTCWICGRPARAGDPLTFDHVVPHSLGGATTLENARAAHRSCNSRRGNGLQDGGVVQSLARGQSDDPRLEKDRFAIGRGC